MTVDRDMLWIVEKAEGLAYRVVDSEAVVVQTSAGMVNVLNGTGTRVWELADGTRTLAEIVEAMAAEYDAPRDAIQADVAQFVSDLASKGLVVLRRGGGAWARFP